MQSRLNPYIHFKGTAREAMEFYKGVFGGKLTMNTFKESGMPVKPEEADNIMHSMLEVENGIVFMGADTPEHMGYTPGATITMSLSGDNAEKLTGYWNGLAAGAKIDQPLMQAPWGDTFGMLTDKFGIEWMVNITGKKA